MYDGNLALKDAEEEQSKLVIILKDINRCKISWKKIFLKRHRIIHSAREKTLCDFRSKIFAIIKYKIWRSAWTSTWTS